MKTAKKKEQISKRLYDNRVAMFGKEKVDIFYEVEKFKLCPTCGQKTHGEC